MSAPGIATRRRIDECLYVLSSGEYSAVVKRHGRQVQRNLGLCTLADARAERDRLIRLLENPPPPAAERLSVRYQQASANLGGHCPIEAGTLLQLADNECQHGRLPFDRSEPCGCWPVEQPVALSMTAKMQAARDRRARVKGLYEAGRVIAEIAAEEGVPVGTVNADLARLRRDGELTVRRNRGYDREEVAA